MADRIPTLDQIKLSCSTAISDADEALDQAHAILVLLGAAFECDTEAETLTGVVNVAGRPDYRRQSCFSELDGKLFSDALSGVSTLLATYKHVRAANAVHFAAAQTEGR